MDASLYFISLSSSISLPHDSLCSTSLHCHQILMCHKYKYGATYTSSQGLDRFRFRTYNSKVRCQSPLVKGIHNASESRYLCVQTLRRFPREKLKGEVVLVRFDSNFLDGILNLNNEVSSMTLSTIKYLYDLGAKVLLVGDWGKSSSLPFLTKSVADHLASVLQLSVVSKSISSGVDPVYLETLNEGSIVLLENLTDLKQETANSLDFARSLSAGVGVFVNDAFSVSHKVLASTVGVTRFCYASLAGFKFEEELSTLIEVAQINNQPYIAIIGGDNFLDKSKALYHLASKCDGLVFVGRIALQIIHVVYGHPNLAGCASIDMILNFVQFLKDRKIPLLLPVDFLCMENQFPKHLDVFPSDGLPDGWTPVGLGPRTLEEIFSMLIACKKIVWIGPVEFGVSGKDFSGESELAWMLEKFSRSGCDVIIVGSAACNAIAKIGGSSPSYKQFIYASSLWEFLKGKTLPGVAALDKAYFFYLEWNTIFVNSTRPMVVDVGSGNGLFLLKMADRWKQLNFLGLEINEKLVQHCLYNVTHYGMKNVYFLTANATNAFRSVISTYPGELVLVSIQCPNPDFHNAQKRWRMVQRNLIEAIEELLANGGKIFLQSDVEEVTTRMKDEFILFSKGKIIVDSSYGNGWVKENPFCIRSDWEQHVLDRGAPMYRIMLTKTGDATTRLSDALHTICGPHAEN